MSCTAGSVSKTDLAKEHDWASVSQCMSAKATSKRHEDQLKVDTIKTHLLSSCCKLYERDEGAYVDAVRQLRSAVKEHDDKPRDLIHAVYCLR